MLIQQAMEVSTQTDSPRESVASKQLLKGVGCGAMEDTGANMSNVQLEATESSQLVERENADLRQQLKALESRYDSSRQLIVAQATELAEKTRVIEALQSKLLHLSNLAAAFADEVHGTGTGMPPYQSLAAQQAPQHKPATPAPQLAIPAAVALLTRLNQQQHQHQQNASAVAAAAAAAEAAAAAGAAVAGVRLPSAGSKRARLCSATGSQAGDATKHAASGGSSSSHQQLSADEELDEDLDNAGDDYAEATAGSYGKRSRSPYSAERLAQSPADAEAAAAAAAEHMDGDEDDEKSQDDLDAAQCLQQLAMSAGAGEAQGANHTSVPALFESVSDRFAAGPNRGAGSNLVRWPSTNATMPGAAAGAAAGYAGSSSSNGNATLHGGGNGGNGSPFDSMMQAQLLAYLGALNNPEGFAGFHNPRAQQQGAQPVQQKRVSLPFGSAPQPQAAQQQQPQHHFGGVTAPLQRSGSLGASWGPATKSPAPAAASGSMSGVARARKQSWFQTEISEKIPVSVQQACISDWQMQKSMQVVCADLSGTFYVNSAGEYLIKLAHSGEVVTPNKFEEMAGKKTARNWQQSIRLVGYTMNGEVNSALLKLGHFTRIVGLQQDK